ncbi:paired amphipathic helix protein Sin3a [Pseudohyphozyma bogoriensis]|nr:paired amphipathic helix protein Sin3a [Pseudohyphozyma bogoriensis]
MADPTPAAGDGGAAPPPAAAAQPSRYPPLPQPATLSAATTAASTPAPAPAPATHPFRPLNVRDALSYLDRVKVTFQDQAEVYDRFLEIMKSFKSQGIDTPGVIERVSSLFRGHPSLIQGFNTFLPPGYRIECSVHTSGSSDGAVTTITVTTPMGMTTRTQVTAPQPGAAARTTATDTKAPLGRPSPLPAPASIPSSIGAAAPKAEAPEVKTAPAAAAPPPAAAAPASADPSKQDNLRLPPLPSAVSSLSNPAPLATPGAASLLSSHLPSASTAAAAPAAAPTAAAAAPASAAAADPNRPPMEFNHAINYVNKIKNRFVRDPETYKAFLEILQTYQKEGRAIQDVYAQVTTLFHSAPDLLDEFKQFLPDTSGDAGAAAPGGLMGQPGPAGGAGAQRPGAGGAAKRPAGTQGKDVATGGSAKKPKLGKNKLEDKNKDKRVAKPVTKEARKHQDVSDSGVYSEGPAPDAQMAYGHPIPGYPQGYPVPGYPSAHPAYAYDPPPLPPPPQPLLAPKPAASASDIAFFTRAKEYINDQPTYHEFLKLLNLYTQDIIDLTALVSRAWLFIGAEKVLWRDFREIVGWSEGKAVGDPGGRVEIVDGVRVVENIPSLDGPRRGKGDAGQDWKTYGPSYRQLPQSEISLNCSGRDALCWDVLNDEWISQPSWASDEGFVAHKKNPYEEALHRSEEERHEYDYHIEANLRTIALLEPIATRITIMEADERATFRLKPGLGNQSKSIYQRVIKKVYGKEQGGEVIQALHENPCVAVPIVLARLKQKDEEWKRALREWNRVWREVDAKNFWKSLDHQAISLKANDKRTLTAKALVNEIETIKREQRPRGLDLRSPPTSQLAYEISDQDVLSDTFKLLFSYLDRTSGISNADKDKLDAFLRQFLPLVFAIPITDFALELAAGNAGQDDESVEATSEAGTSVVDEVIDQYAASLTSKRGGKKTGGDLRKKALKNAGGPGGRGGPGRRSKVSSPAPSSRGASPAPSTNGANDSDVVMGDATAAGLASVSNILAAETPAASSLDEATPRGVSSREASAVPDEFPSPSIDADGPESSVGTPEPTGVAEEALPELIVPVDENARPKDVRRRWNFFSNSNLYCIMRLFQIVYHRMKLLKGAAGVLVSPPAPRPITVREVPSLSLSLSIAPPASVTNAVPAALIYQRALGLAEKLFDGDIDQTTFEDSVRGMFGTEAYAIFTVDKLFNSILKLSQTALSDSRSQELFDLLMQDRAHPDRSTPQQQTAYRIQAESAIGSDENLYRFEWLPGRQLMSIQLLGKDAIAQDDVDAAEREWGTYLENYVLSEKTPGTRSDLRQPFLTRNLKTASPDGTDSFPTNLTVKSSLQCKICLRSYRLFFVAGSEDYVYRKRHVSEALITEVKEKRQSKFAEWVEKRLEGAKEKEKEEGRDGEKEKEKEATPATSTPTPTKLET